MQVKSNRHVIRLFLLEYLKHNIKEAIHRIGMLSLTVGQHRKPVKCTVQNAVAIYQNDLFWHNIGSFLILLFLSAPPAKAAPVLH